MSAHAAATADQPDTSPAEVKADKTGLLIIRAWVEEGSSQRLRAEVRSTTDVSAGIQRTLNLARAAEVGAEVQDWLADVMGVAEQPG